MAAIAIFASCEKNQSSPEDPTLKNQPEDPATWSPAGKKYISTDNSNYGRYLDKKITFFSRDSVDLEFLGGHYLYRLEYPLIHLGHTETPWLKFIDTLTITKAYEMSDESSCYVLME